MKIRLNYMVVVVAGLLLASNTSAQKKVDIWHPPIKKGLSNLKVGAMVNFPVKNDYYVLDGTKEPIFKADTNQVNPASILKYADISDYREGVNSEGFSGGSGIVRDPVNKTVRAFFLNQPIYTSYVLLFIQLSVVK